MGKNANECSFCGRIGGRDVFLISSALYTDTCICNYCVEQAYNILMAEI